MVRRALQGEVQRDFQPDLVRRRDEGAEVLLCTQLRVDRVVATFQRADRPRRTDVALSGDERVVAALAVDPADRVDRRQVDDVEAHLRDPGQPVRGGREGTVPDRLSGRVDHGAFRAREELVPRREQRALAIGPQRVRRRAGDQVPYRMFPEQLGEIERRRYPLEQRKLVVAQRRHGGRHLGLRLIRYQLRRLVQDVRALDEIVGEILDALPGPDLLVDPVPPGQVRVAPRLDGERPAPDRVGSDGGVPGVRTRVAGLHPGERSTPAARPLPDHVAAERRVSLAVRTRRHGHQLTDDRLGRVTSTRDRRRHVFDRESSGHRSPR